VAEDGDRPLEQRRLGLKEHHDRALGYLERGLDLVKKEATGDGEYSRFKLLWHKANLLLDDLDRAHSYRDEDAVAEGDLGPLKADISRVIEQVRKGRVPAAADYLRGRLLIHDHKWAEAATHFERARALLAPQPDLKAQANLYLGQCYEKLEEHKQMYEAYKQVADWDPSSVPAQLGMASARWAQGKLDQALEQFNAVMRQGMVPPRGWLDIARLEMQRQSGGDKPQWKGVRAALDNAEKANPDAFVEVALLRAELRLREGKPSEARAVLQKARGKHPKAVELWAGLADLLRSQKDAEGAQKVLDEAGDKLGDRTALRLARARHLAGTRGKKAMTKIVSLAEDTSRFNEDDQAKLYNGLAEVLLRLGEHAEARRLWQRMARLPRQAGELRLRLLLFDLAIKAGDEPGMKDALEEIRTAEQSAGAFHRYGTALQLIWQVKNKKAKDARKALDQARLHLDRVQSLRPSWPAVFLARAEIAELNGNPEQAIKDFKEAVKNGETGVGVIQRLVTLLFQRGQDSEAKMYLDQVRAALKANAALLRVDAAVALRQKNFHKALESARQAVRDDTGNVRDLVWLAWVYAEAGQPDKAKELFERAIQVGNGDPVPWVALVQFLVQQKDKAEAEAVIARAKEKLAGDQKALAIGRCYDLVGQTKQAERYYREALKVKKDDPEVLRSVASYHLNAGRLQQAEPILRQLTSGLKGASAEDVAWAKRSLAMVLAAGTDYRRFTEALALVGLKLDGAGRLVRDNSPADESTEARRAKARVLASQNQKQFRTRAIELLEELSRAKALTADDQYVLSLLYDAEGKDRKAHSQLEDLLRGPTRNPRYLAQYIMRLVTQRRLPSDLEEAEKKIAILEELERQSEVEPNTFASVEMRVRLLEARRKGDDALELLRKHVTRSGAKPEEVVLLIGSLARQRRYKEAFELCEETWEAGKCPPEAVGGVCLALLRVMEASDTQVKQLEKHLRAAIRAKPDSTVLLMHLSTLCDMRGQYDEAAVLYRKVLKKEPNNIVALNNLAWLLALRSGDTKEALNCITAAVNGMGRRADLLDTRGLVHLARKEPRKALEDLQEANSDAPTPTRLFHLAQAHHAAGERVKASDSLREAKRRGLEVAKLHPVEQQACRELLQEYGIKVR
jgi:tetratricopeptide (TPR) repeat protein